MEIILEYFDGGPWLNFFAILIGLIGIIISLYLGLKSIRKKRPFYAIRSINILSDNIKNFNGISIKYNNLEVKKFNCNENCFLESW